MSKYVYRIKVRPENVIDGDTLKDVMIDLGFDVWHKTTIRLYGIQSPEIRTKNLEVKERGLKAKKYLQEVCEIQHHKEWIATIHKKGKYGRWIASIEVGEHDLSQSLIVAGHAKGIEIKKRIKK